MPMRNLFWSVALCQAEVKMQYLGAALEGNKSVMPEGETAFTKAA